MSFNVEVRSKNTFLDFREYDNGGDDDEGDSPRARSVGCVGRFGSDTEDEGKKLRVWKLRTLLRPVGLASPTTYDVDVRSMRSQRSNVSDVSTVSTGQIFGSMEASKHADTDSVQQVNTANSCAFVSERCAQASCQRTNSSRSLSTVASSEESLIEEYSLASTIVACRLSQEVCPTLPSSSVVESSMKLPQRFAGLGRTASLTTKPQDDSREFKHRTVPKLTDLAKKYGALGKDAAPTTVMIRNIPSAYNQCEMIRELNAMGFEGTYDFLYLPLDSGTMSSVGYAFVNFADSSDAERCMRAFSKYRFKYHRNSSGKVAYVSVAHIQGLAANLAHYEKRAVNSPKMKQFSPILLPVIAKSEGEAIASA